MFHDVLCVGGGGREGVDRSDELDIDDAIEDGMCCACAGSTHAEQEECDARVILRNYELESLNYHFDERTMVQVLG